MAHRSRSIGVGAIALATGILIALPTFSGGATVKNDLRSFTPAQPRVVHQSATPTTEPPLHGTNPHGQGTAAVVDLSPSATRPFTVDPDGDSADEDIVIGRSRGEQRADGTYRGHVTVASLFGNEIIAGATTVAGDAPVDRAIADDILDGLCTASGICIDVARVRSNTNATSSFNSFSLASLALGGAVPVPGVPGVPALRLGAAESVGNITSDSVCQTANGASQVVDLAAGTAVAEIAESSSASRACRGEAPTQTNTSRVIELGGAGVPLPAAGCADGTPDTETGLPLLLPVVCNADDSSAAPTNGNQADPQPTSSAYGVRHALDVYVLAVPGISALAQVSTAQSETRVIAPAAAGTPTTTTPTTTTTTTTPTTTTTTTTPTTTTTTPAGVTPGADDTGDTGDTGDAGDTAGDDDAGAAEDTGDEGAGGPSAGDGAGDDGAVNLGGDELPFTGTDVVVLGLAGSLLLAAGLTLRGPARRRDELDA